MALSGVLVIGGTRGLGAELVKYYASHQDGPTYATTRSDKGPNGFPESVKWLPKVDLMDKKASDTIVSHIDARNPLSTVVISAGHFSLEDLSKEKGPNWDEEQRMYTTSCIAPVFVVHRLSTAGLLGKGTKVVLISSEAGSITLRHPSEGGGNYAHHATKTALNMVGKLLSLDLKDQEVIVSMVHPGFMRTEMTKGVGFDKFWDDGGAVTPKEAAETLAGWVDKLDISKSGEFWAPRGPGDIGTAEAVLGSGLPTPCQLPW